MGLRLNNISDIDARQDLASYREQIAKWETKGPTDQRRVASEAPRYYEKLSDLYFKAGALAFQQQASVYEIQSFFRRAGETTIEMFEHRGTPQPSTNRNYSLLVQRSLGCVAGFCDYSWRARLGAIHESRYYWPHDPKWTFMPEQREQPRSQQGEYKVEYMRLAVELLVTSKVNVPKVQALIAELKHKSLDEFEEPHHCLWALMAISDRNPGFLDQTLGRLLQLHQSSAKHGHYRDMTEGLLSMNCLFLARMALERQIPVTVYSDYLPLTLLY